METLMLIDASHPEETRVVITENGAVQDYDFSLASKKQIKGNIYLAKVTRVEPSLQAAFIEYGGNRQGFLPFSEIHPDYYQIPMADREELMKEEEEFIDEQENLSAPADKQNEIAEPNEGEQQDSPLGADALLEDGVQESATTEETYETTASENRESELELASAGNSELEPITNTSGHEQSESKQDIEHVGGAIEEEIVRTAKKFRFQKRYKIQEVIKKGQVILIQVIKEERGNKGAAVSTYISLPGRYCVLMPNTMRTAGISRRISDPRDRQRLKSVTDGLDVPKGMSVIIRTAGIDRSKPEIKRDYEYLMKLWNTIRENTLSSYAPSLIYEEGDIIKRSLRDLYTPTIDEILIQGDEAFKVSKEMMKALMPSHAAKVKPYAESVPLFYRYDVEDQLRSIHEPAVKLRSGGYIVFGSTEALVAIDVNSGRSTSERHIEETASRTNLEAAVEIARQIKLRDLAGLVVIDFIDMMDGKNRRAVEKTLKEALKSDRAKIQVGRISTFGLLEMTRQRLRPSITESVMQVCPKCAGHGLVKNTETLSLDIIRELEVVADSGSVRDIKVETYPDCALYLLNNKRTSILTIEQNCDVKIEIIITDEDLPGGFKMNPAYQPAAKNAGKQKHGRQRPERKHQAPSPAPEQHKVVSFEPHYEEILVDDEAETASVEGAQENPQRERTHPNKRKRIPGKPPRGNKPYPPKHHVHAGQDGNSDSVSTPLSEVAANDAEPVEAVTTESVHGGGGEHKGRRKNWKKPDNRDRRPVAATSGDPVIAASTSETVIAPVSKPITSIVDSVESQKPKRASKIEKISEFKVREKKKDNIHVEEDTSPGNPDGPKRSGWWGKLIK